jgi:hypothetical protein
VGFFSMKKVLQLIASSSKNFFSGNKIKVVGDEKH